MKSGQEKGLFLNFGTSQEERIISALMPENIRIDDRQIQDYIAFCMEVAGMIKFPEFIEDENLTQGNIDQNKKIEFNRNWTQFFEKDPSIFLALLIHEQPEKMENEIRNQIQRFYQSQGEVRLEVIATIIPLINDSIQKINSWYIHSIPLLAKQSENLIYEILFQVIDKEATKDTVTNFWKLLREIEKKGLVPVRKEFEALRQADPVGYVLTQLNELHPHWKLGENVDKVSSRTILLDTDVDKAQHQVAEELRAIFQYLHLQMVFLNQKALPGFYESLHKIKDHEPHVALLLSFLQLFLYARDQINIYPKKHLDHYFIDYLLQRTKPSIPDRTIICFQLTDQVKYYHLPRGIELLAGVDENGLASTYKTLEPTNLYDTVVDHLQTLYISKSPLQRAGSSYRLVAGIYAAPVANSKNGLGPPFLEPGDSWSPFGEEQLELPQGDRQMIDARIGFVIATPVLWLQAADREIELRFQLTSASLRILLDLIEDISFNTKQERETVINRLFLNSVELFLSTAAGWFQVERWKINGPEQWMSNNSITLFLYLSNQDPAIVDNQPEVLGEQYQSPWPLLKLVLNPAHQIYLYSFVSELELEMIQITTQVEGLKSLSLVNEVGPIDISAPFQPFGPIPGPKAYFLVGCQELFSKRVNELKLHLDWNNLPEEESGFAEYFKEYQEGIDNNSYKVLISALSGSVFKPNPPLDSCKFELFTEDQQKRLLPRTSIIGIPVNELSIKPEFSKRALEAYTPNVTSGYLKLQLQGPQMAFGHSLYNRLFSKAMIDQAQANSSLFARLTETPKEIAFPREPFTPQIFRISLDYTASTRLHFNPSQTEENDEFANEKVIRLSPYGQKEIFFDGRAIDRFLFPQFEADGYLFIGLSKAVPNQFLNLFFQLNESKKSSLSDELTVQWHYLNRNLWEPFPSDSILADYTQKFTTSGIIKLVLPNEIQTDNTLMPSGVFWIRASAKGNLENTGRVLNVRTNATEIGWVNNGDPDHFDPRVPRPPIQGLLVGISEIAACQQVMPFYGDRPEEQASAFYTRVSERLRHKNRGVTDWDIERLVLEQFPELWQVKCIGPMLSEEIRPGEIRVAVVPKITEGNLEPKLGFNQLESIEAFIDKKTSAFASIKVINPVYEKIKINIKVLLQKGLEQELGVYLQRLHEEILYFICSWLKAGSLPLGGYLSKNDLFDFIRGRPYIKYATGFSLVHIFQENEVDYKILDTAVYQLEDQLIYTSTPWSVFIPIDQHNIQFLDSAHHFDPVAIAIDGMRLGTDFIVGMENSGLQDSGTDTDLSDAQNLGVKEVTPPEKPDKSSWYLISN